jgi:hypothetical protein
MSVIAPLLATAIVTKVAVGVAAPVPKQTPNVLIVGGGPDPDNNQAAIESNVRYVSRIVTGKSRITTLFADGNLRRKTVAYYHAPPDRDSAITQNTPRESAIAQHVFNLLLVEDEEGESGYRRPRLGTPLHGPSMHKSIDNAFTRLSRNSQTAPALLYFTGHGGHNERDEQNNYYNLWGDEELSVRDLSRQIARLPAGVPVTLVMVQCYSGAFGNVLFRDGNPKADLVARDIVGFFASTCDRYAAGCTAEVNEAEYHDFTSYFFAALTGRDRVGRSVTGADTNKDGRVGMDEAFYYTVANDKSIDVPVSTSDVFLRRFAAVPEKEWLQRPYSSVRAWANPAQRAALDILSKRAKLSGEQRLTQAKMRTATYSTIWGVPGRLMQRSAITQSYEEYTKVFLAEQAKLVKRWPTLEEGDDDSAKYRAARKAAIAQLERDAKAGKLKALLRAEDEYSEIYYAAETKEVEHAYALRFLRLGESIVLARQLRQKAPQNVRTRFERLVAREAMPLLPGVR